MKEFSGSLRKNDRKEKESHPDIKGSCLIDGTEYWISGWRKDGDSGQWYSLAFSAKEAKPAQKQATTGGMDSMTDDIPF